MGFHLTIYRVRRAFCYEDTSYKIKLLREDGAEAPLENPVEIREEFYLGKGAFPIHYWFIKYTEGLSETIGLDYARDVMVGFSDLVELRDIIKKVLDEPKLAKELLPLPEYENDKAVPSKENYDVDILEKPYKQLNRIIEQHDYVECLSYYIYEAG